MRREGKMDVQILYEPGLVDAAVLKCVADAIDSKLAMSGERLVRLLTHSVRLVGGIYLVSRHRDVLYG